MQAEDEGLRLVQLCLGVTRCPRPPAGRLLDRYIRILAMILYRFKSFGIDSAIDRLQEKSCKWVLVSFAQNSSHFAIAYFFELPAVVSEKRGRNISETPRCRCCRQLFAGAERKVFSSVKLLKITMSAAAKFEIYFTRHDWRRNFAHFRTLFIKILSSSSAANQW